MGHAFEGETEAEVDATPEQIWAAIATGPGADSWFMGTNHVEPGPGGTVRTLFGAYRGESLITGWDPPHRLAYGSEPAPDGRFMAYEFLIEGRGGGSTVLRLVTSGFLPGDDWETEYDAMTKGGALFFATLRAYVEHFAGRTATPVTAFGPIVADWGRTWAALRGRLGLGDDVKPGQTVRFTPGGLAPIDGVVYFVNEHTLGIRTDDAIYRFLRGLHGPMVAAHHIFTRIDEQTTQGAWESWLTGLERG
ncbi:SRPBCC domain-containing protein [Spongiactinospora sp. 9N601]|uniref:SRPBCC domain-containing protein n=1 Tax=Spongiactinospora sp. 9N601 TaxID=3375149 RepID=UPI00378ABBB9